MSAFIDTSKIKVRDWPLKTSEIVFIGYDPATGPDSWVKAAHDPETGVITILELSTTDKPLPRPG